MNSRSDHVAGLTPKSLRRMRDRARAFEVLRSRGWFSRINKKMQAALEAESRLVHARCGEQIFHVGDPGAGLFGIVEGSILLSFPREDGVLVPFSPFGTGYWLGDLAALSGKPGMVSIDVRADVTAVNVPAQRVRRLVKKNPEFYKSFYELNRQNLKVALRLLLALTGESAEQRIALRLRVMADYSVRTDGWVDITNQEMAAQTGLSVPTVQRAVSRLVKCGFLERGYSRIRILDSEAYPKSG
ncbi:Crp/Fnr family transcriptional regulator [Primorskyibacter sp. S87]|uniref:Crp/Fnr family transcriptional regulator n=1 Tax=Primorskyibacter sp. S87 TaxID=3415126 RepID=UPI003C7BF506